MCRSVVIRSSQHRSLIFFLFAKTTLIRGQQVMQNDKRNHYFHSVALLQFCNAVSFSVGSALSVLFLGNFSKKPPPQSMLNAFHEFLQYSVDIGKLSIDYKLYGEREKLGSLSKSDKLDEALSKPPFDAHFTRVLWNDRTRYNYK